MTNELEQIPKDEDSAGAMVRLGIINKLDPATLEKLMALQERYDANEAKKAFVKAMAGFKREAPAVIGKDKKADFGQTSSGKSGAKYSYATTGAIVAAITPALAKYGLHLSWETKQEPNAVHVTCHVTHEQGHRESATLCGPRDESGGKNPIQTIGSAVHYLQRYTMVSVLGLATADMDDPDAGDTREPVGMPTAKAGATTEQHAKPDGGKVTGPVEDIRVAKGKDGKPDQFTIVVAGVKATTLKKEHADLAKDAKTCGRSIEMAWLRKGEYVNVAAVNVAPDIMPEDEKKRIEEEEAAQAAKEARARGELV